VSRARDERSERVYTADVIVAGVSGVVPERLRKSKTPIETTFFLLKSLCFCHAVFQSSIEPHTPSLLP